MPTAHSASGDCRADDAPKSFWWFGDGYASGDRLSEFIAIRDSIGSMQGIRQLQACQLKPP